MTITEFILKFPNDKACEDYLTNQKYKDGAYCSSCGSTHVCKINRPRKHQYYKCNDCKGVFTVLTNTVFHGSKLSLQKWFLCIYFMYSSSKGMSSVQLAKNVGVRQGTAWLVLTKLRELSTTTNNHFIGTVEADETFIGGLEKNKHASQKKGILPPKSPVIGIINRDTKQVIAKHIPDTKAITLKKYIYDNVKGGSNVYTDDYNGYKRMQPMYKHESTKHGQGEYVKDKIIHTNTIESFWSIFKRGYIGVYHYMSKKHLQRYINEYTFRYNNKDKEIVNNISHLIERKALTYRELICE